MGQVPVAHLREQYPGAIIEWMPFLLRPGMPPEGLDLTDEFKEDMADARERISRVAASGGLPLVFPDHAPNTRRALEATEYARLHGRGAEFHRAVFNRLYGRGEDISDWDVLRSAADEAGLDADDMQQLVASGRFQADVEAQADAARELGIHAVPTFVINDDYRIVGVQPLEVFEEEIRRARGIQL